MFLAFGKRRRVLESLLNPTQPGEEPFFAFATAKGKGSGEWKKVNVVNMPWFCKMSPILDN